MIQRNPLSPLTVVIRLASEERYEAISSYRWVASPSGTWSACSSRWRHRRQRSPDRSRSATNVSLPSSSNSTRSPLPHERSLAAFSPSCRRSHHGIQVPPLNHYARGTCMCTTNSITNQLCKPIAWSAIHTWFFHTWAWRLKQRHVWHALCIGRSQIDNCKGSVIQLSLDLPTSNKAQWTELSTALTRSTWQCIWLCAFRIYNSVEVLKDINCWQRFL